MPKQWVGVSGLSMNVNDAIYHKEKGCWLIEIQLHSLAQLFNTFDPSPFHEKDLDPDAEEYIVSTAVDLGMKSPTRMIIYLPMEELKKENPATVQDAIHNFFRYQESASRRELRKVLRNGRTSLVIGILFLSACLTVPAMIPALLARQFLEQWLMIFGWVAMWHPIEVFLYQWWPIRHTIRIFHALSEIEVILLPDTEREPVKGFMRYPSR